jgi:hypothetical protein
LAAARISATGESGSAATLRHRKAVKRRWPDRASTRPGDFTLGAEPTLFGLLLYVLTEKLIRRDRRIKSIHEGAGDLLQFQLSLPFVDDGLLPSVAKVLPFAFKLDGRSFEPSDARLRRLDRLLNFNGFCVHDFG